MKNYDISYFVPSRLPTEKAYGFQILKTCEILSKHNQINNLNIFYPKRNNIIKGNIYDYYQITDTSNLNLLELGNEDNFEKFKFLGEKLSFKLHLISYFYNILKNKKKIYNTTIFIRDYYLLIFFLIFRSFINYKLIFFEVHEKIYFNKLNLFLLKKVNHIFAISKSLYEHYKKCNSNVTLVNSITDQKIINKRYQLKDSFKSRYIKNNNINVGIIGNTSTKGIDKGHLDLLKKIKYIKNYNFFFVGLDELNFDISKKIILKNQNKNIHLFKKIKFKNIYKFYDICDSFIIYYPNIEYFNNSSPVKIFECLSTYKPILCNQNKSITSILKNNVNCFTFSNDLNDISEIIDKVSDISLISKIKKNNKILYEDYDVNKKIFKIIDILNSK